MPIFGMNGLTFLALDLALVFAVYGMKAVALTKEQVAGLAKVVARKSMTGSAEEKAAIARNARDQIVRTMAAKSGRYTTEASLRAFQAKNWLR